MTATWDNCTSAALRKNFVYNITYQSSVAKDVHDLLNGSDITPGLSAACGYAFPLSGTIRLPVEIRADAVFGNATPIMLRASIGLSFSNGAAK